MSNTIFFDNSETMRKVLGANDCNLKYLELLLKTAIQVRGNRIVVEEDNISKIGRASCRERV